MEIPVNCYVKIIRFIPLKADIQMRIKILLMLLIVHVLVYSNAMGQSFVGSWEYHNNDNERVIIELGENSEYNLSIP